MDESEGQGDAVERDAVAALRRGDISGLESLVRRYQAPGLRLAIALAGDREVAEDAVSDAFLAVRRYIGSFDPTRPFEPWFYRILVNRVRRLLRQEQQQRRSQQAWLTTAHRIAPLPEEEVVQQESGAVVRNAIQQLPIKQREALIFTYYLDMDTATIATIQAVPVGTVKWRLFQGRRRLRAALAGHTDGLEGPPTEVLIHEPRT